jgi:hypothetical protein
VGHGSKKERVEFIELVSGAFVFADAPARCHMRSGSSCRPARQILSFPSDANAGLLIILAINATMSISVTVSRDAAIVH